MTEHSPAVQVALAQLGEAMDAMDTPTRVQTARAIMGAGAEAQARPFWDALFMLTGSTEQDRLNHLASVLEVVGPRVRQAVATMAATAQRDDQPRRAIWRALGRLVAALAGEE